VSVERRGALLVGAAIALSAALIGIFLAAGGSSYTPVEVRDPCDPREWRDPASLEQVAEQFSLSALDGAACELGVTRERLARALATPEARERFTEQQGIDDMELARAIRAGLLRAVDDAERADVLPPLLADPLRETVRDIPLDQAIELIEDARSLLDRAQSFIDPAEELLEQLFR
jgi:hypothetical protein